MGMGINFPQGHRKAGAPLSSCSSSSSSSSSMCIRITSLHQKLFSSPRCPPHGLRRRAVLVLGAQNAYKEAQMDLLPGGKPNTPVGQERRAGVYKLVGGFSSFPYLLHPFSIPFIPLQQVRRLSYNISHAISLQDLNSLMLSNRHKVGGEGRSNTCTASNLVLSIR